MSVDALAFRRRIGSLILSPNSIVEPDFNRMCPPGVTVHTARAPLWDMDISTDEALTKLLRSIGESLVEAAGTLFALRPDALVLGISLESFAARTSASLGGKLAASLPPEIPLIEASSAVEAALKTLRIERLAVLTPYRPEANELVRAFLSSIGVEVVALTSVDCPQATSIAEVPEEELRRQLCKLAEAKPQAIFQSGTNLSVLRLADEAERWLGLPVLSVNAVLWWHAMRSVGVRDQMHGFGPLLREH